jgi:hypothetical protein
MSYSSYLPLHSSHRTVMGAIYGVLGKGSKWRQCLTNGGCGLAVVTHLLLECVGNYRDLNQVYASFVVQHTAASQELHSRPPYPPGVCNHMAGTCWRVRLLLIHGLLSQCCAAVESAGPCHLMQPPAALLHGFDMALDYSRAAAPVSGQSSTMCVSA